MARQQTAEELRPRRKLVAYALLALVPGAVIVAGLVLAAMAASSAAATGGCGGG